MRKKISILLTITTLTVALFGCSTADSDNKTTSTKTETAVSTVADEMTAKTLDDLDSNVSYGEEFDKDKEKYVSYIKTNFEGDIEADSDTIFSFHIKENDETKVNLGMAYFTESGNADKYMEGMRSSLADEYISDYGMGDDSILYVPDNSDSDSEKPAYIYVEDGNNVWYAVYYDGYKDTADAFMNAMMK